MTDQGQPLSRRERRAMERLAAGQDIESAMELDSSGIPTRGPDGKPLSRRERRRYERAENPIETWTAEEERLATGQIPAMTPEKIAEQERIEREKAERANAEARAASAELRQVSGEIPRSDSFATAGPERESVFSAPSPADSPSDVTPSWMGDIQRTVAAESHAQSAVESTETGHEDDTSQIPEALRSLFPPGSLQARALSESGPPQAAESSDGRVSQESAPHDAGAPSSGAQQAEEPVDPAEEIRRLTAAAIAQMDSAYASNQHDQPEQPAATDRYSGQFDEPVFADAGQDDAGQDDAGQDDAGQDDAGPNYGQPSADTPAPGFAAATFEGFAERPQEPSSQHSGEQAIQPPSLEPDVHGSPSTGGSPQVEQEQASPWGAHPLAQAESAPRELGEFEPVAEVPQPDLSQLTQAQSAPEGSPFAPTQTPFTPTGGPGTGPTSGSFPTMEPISTGNIEVPRRQVPELQAAGGARDFRVAHLAVIGAVAFAIGIVVWHLAGA